MSIERFDDWTNTMATLGSVRDKATGLQFGRRRRLTREQLDALYEQNPIAARVVDRLPFDAFREGWSFSSFEGDADPSVLHKRLQDELGLDQVLEKAVRWSRLYGGALIVQSIADGRSPDEPIDLARASGLFAPMVLAAEDATPLTYDAQFGSATYREILSYQINGLQTSTALLEVHHSRTVHFEPIDLPLEARIRSNFDTGWGPSVLDRLFDDLGREGSARSHAVSMLYIASILYVKLNGLRDALKAKGGEATVAKILGNMRSNMDVLGLLGLDVEDDIGSVQHAIQGVHELIDRLRNALAAAAEMPREILFNESPAGLNAGQLSGPQEIWFALVSAFQAQHVTPVLRRMIDIALAVWKIPHRGYEIDWAPLWVRSDEASSEIARRDAETDQLYLDMGVLTVEQIRQQRFVEGRRGPLQLTAEDVAAMPAVANLPPPVDAPEPEDAVDVRDAAKRFGFPTRTITRAIERGELGSWGIGTRRTVSLREVSQLARKNFAEPLAPAV